MAPFWSVLDLAPFSSLIIFSFDEPFTFLFSLSFQFPWALFVSLIPSSAAAFFFLVHGNFAVRYWYIYYPFSILKYSMIIVCDYNIADFSSSPSMCSTHGFCDKALYQSDVSHYECNNRSKILICWCNFHKMDSYQRPLTTQSYEWR